MVKRSSSDTGKKQEDFIEIGKKIGRKEGIEEGRETGREEGVKNIVLRMLKKGTFSIEAIAETTELSEEAVRMLSKEMSDLPK